jgi:hypothetical protein
MNELALATQFIIDGLNDNPLVHTISFEKTSDIDLNKSNIYPLANVDIIDSNMIEDLIYINYTITILNDRNIEKELNNKKIYSSNLIDNLNECHSIAVRFVNHIKSNANNKNDIEIFSMTNIQMLKFTETNILDGVRFTIQLEIPNNSPC